MIAMADVEVIGGSLTYHLLDLGTSDYYSNKLTKNGRLLNNPMFGLAYTEHASVFFVTQTVFGGSNSVGKQMAGFLYTEGIEISGLQVGITYGGYEQESKYYDNLGLNSFRVVNISGIDLVPVLGLQVNYKIKLSDDYYLKLNNLIDPVLFNTTLSFGRSF
jgi:hypothetical protein